MLQTHSYVLILVFPRTASHFRAVHWRTPSNSIHLPVINSQRILVILAHSEDTFSAWRKFYQHYCSLVEPLQDYFLLLGISVPHMHVYDFIGGLGLVEFCHLAGGAVLAVLGDGEGYEVVGLALVEGLAAGLEVHLYAECSSDEEAGLAALGVPDLVPDSVVDVEVAYAPDVMDFEALWRRLVLVGGFVVERSRGFNLSEEGLDCECLVSFIHLHANFPVVFLLLLFFPELVLLLLALLFLLLLLLLLQLITAVSILIYAPLDDALLQSSNRYQCLIVVHPFHASHV